MNNRPGPDEGANDHPASAGGSGVGGHGGSETPGSGDGLRDELANATWGDPRLAAFLDRSAEVLQAGPDEMTAHRHLAAMRKEAAAVAPASPRILRAASISAAAAVALVVTLASFGALPAPAQQVLSDVADRVGITIPSPADRAPSGEVPAKQRPAAETVPGQPGGPDRSELPGLDEDGTLRTPGASDGRTPPGHADDRPGRDQAPGQDRGAPESSGEAPAPDRPGEAEQRPEQGEQPPGQVEQRPRQAEQPTEQPDPPAAPDPPEPPESPQPPDPPEPPGRSDGEGPPVSGQGSGTSGEEPDRGRARGDRSSDTQGGDGTDQSSGGPGSDGGDPSGANRP